MVQRKSEAGFVFLPVLAIILLGSVIGWGVSKGLDAATAPHVASAPAPEPARP